MLSAYRRYGESFTSYDALKLFAILTMTIDHVGVFFFPDELWWRAIGRWSAPMWLFLAGYSRSNRTWPLILGCACVVFIPHFFIEQRPPLLNVLFSVLIARIIVEAVRRRGWHETRLPEITAVLFLLAPVSIYLFDYGTMGIAFALFGSLMRDTGTNKRNAYYAAVLWFTYCLLQSASLSYNVPQLLALWLGNAGIFWLLSRFRILSLGSGNTVLQKNGKFLARASVYYYVLHRLGFLAASIALGITRHPS